MANQRNLLKPRSGESIRPFSSSYEKAPEHSHAGHKHEEVPGKAGNEGRKARDLGLKFRVALFITLAFVLVEFTAGFFANSLALISDAGHNFSDALALGFSWFALTLASRSPTPRKTYGFHRAGILAASLNSISLVLIALFILYEGVQRLLNPPQVESWVVVIVAGIALLINLTIARLLHSHAQNDLNVRSAFLHILTDVAASLGVIIAGLGQALTGWAFFDPLISLVIGFLILGSCWGIIRESTNVLLEGIPSGLVVEDLVADLKNMSGVSEVHDLHAWTIGSGRPVLSCHLQLKPECTLQEATQIVQGANSLLEGKYKISHSTIQVECENCETNCNM